MSTPVLPGYDSSKLSKKSLQHPVCAGYSRYHWGPKEVLIAGTGTGDSHAWKYSYVNQKLTKLTMEPGFLDASKYAAGNDYIIELSQSRKTYRLFDLKKMAWSKKSGKAKIVPLTGIVPVHVSMNICPISDK